MLKSWCTHLWRRHRNPGKLLYLRGKRSGRSTTAKGASAVPDRQLPCGIKPWIWKLKLSNLFWTGMLSVVLFHFREDQRYSCNGMGLFNLSSSNRHFLMKGKCIIWWFHNSIQNILLEFLTTDVKTVKHVLDAGAMLGKRSQATFVCFWCVS